MKNMPRRLIRPVIVFSRALIIAAATCGMMPGALLAGWQLDQPVRTSENAIISELDRHDARVPAERLPIEAIPQSRRGEPVLGTFVAASADARTTAGEDDLARRHLAPAAAVNQTNVLGTRPLVDFHGDHAIDAGGIESALGDDCQPQWLPTFGGAPGMNSWIWTVVVFDDGSGDGPALYAGGYFTVAGGSVASRVAKWDGSAWSPLGDGIDGPVFAMTAVNDGQDGGPALYVGGEFSSAGGTPANNVARWDGSSWSALGDGVDGTVFALEVYDEGAVSGPAVFAGGEFVTAGGDDGVTAAGLAQWDGSSWSAVGDGLAGADPPLVRALHVFDDGAGSGPALYVGGAFDDAGAIVANNIARWDGTTWSALGTGVDARWNAPLIRTIASYNDQGGGESALFVGGAFDIAGDANVSHLARWNGAMWEDVGTGVGGTVYALTVVAGGANKGPVVYAGGAFTEAGGQPASRVARWDGASWSPLTTGTGGWDFPYVLAMTGYDAGDGNGPLLYVCGSFFTAGGLDVEHVATWDGDAWSQPGAGLNDAVLAIEVFDDGDGTAIYAGGRFTYAGGNDQQYLAQWNGTSWVPVGDALNGRVRSLHVHDDGTGPALYVGGEFTMAGGLEVNHIAKWDGESWSALDTGMSSRVRTLTTYDDGNGPALYAGGDFQTAGGVVVNYIARWDGTGWSPLGDGLSHWVLAMTAFDDGSESGPSLYVGGSFTHAGSTVVNRIARWDGKDWSPLATGVNSIVESLAVFDTDSGSRPGLVAGGLFTSAGPIEANHIARWDGQAWQALGAGVTGSVSSMQMYDDGTGDGPALFVGGSFTSAGGMFANRIASWNGSNWTTPDQGVSGNVLALEVFESDAGEGPLLHVGGFFPVSPSGDSYLARYGGCAPSAGPVGDLNADGIIDGADVALLLGAWGACGDCLACPADLDGDCQVDGADLAILLGNWTD